MTRRAEGRVPPVNHTYDSLSAIGPHGGGHPWGPRAVTRDGLGDRTDLRVAERRSAPRDVRSEQDAQDPGVLQAPTPKGPGDPREREVPHAFRDRGAASVGPRPQDTRGWGGHVATPRGRLAMRRTHTTR